MEEQERDDRILSVHFVDEPIAFALSDSVLLHSDSKLANFLSSEARNPSADGRVLLKTFEG